VYRQKQEKQGTYMLDKIKELFKEELQYTHTAGLLQQMANILNIVHAQYMKDADGKNAAIDAICEILQSHKDKPATAEPNKECPQCP
jgi:hypothetical protein